jgi:hypothetical protein
MLLVVVVADKKGIKVTCKAFSAAGLQAGRQAE